MKVAILILAHHQPAHLRKLITALRSDWTTFFIHIDSKSNLSLFKKHIPEYQKIHWLEGERRVAVYWGGFSIVQATLYLLNESFQSRERFDRFCLLSGSDFPIKPLHRIWERFATDTEFIRVDRRLDDPQELLSKKIRYYHNIDESPQRQLPPSGIIPRPMYKKDYSLPRKPVVVPDSRVRCLHPVVYQTQSGVPGISSILFWSG